MIRVILNPYGIAYSVGILARGTPRANPAPLGLQGYLDLADRIGVAGVEIFTPLLDGLDDAALSALKDRFARRHQHVVMSQPLATGLDRSIHCARILGASVIRCHATPILCGDRAAPDCDWAKHLANVRKLLQHWSPRLAEHQLHLALENHQDFTSAELMELCEQGGENIGITFDIGNALAVGEDPVAFARTIASRVRHIHLKDYRAHWSDQGYRLVRCAIGDGAVPFQQVLAVLDQPNGVLSAAIEPGALHARHVRLFTSGWWNGYANRSLESVIAALRTARRNCLCDADDWRTPWELEQPHDVVAAYEMAQLDKSVANLKTMGLM